MWMIVKIKAYHMDRLNKLYTKETFKSRKETIKNNLTTMIILKMKRTLVDLNKCQVTSNFFKLKMSYFYKGNHLIADNNNKISLTLIKHQTQLKIALQKTTGYQILILIYHA